MNLAAALFDNARLHGFMDVPALLTDEVSLSYADLDRRSNQAANLLRDMGARENDRILILLRDTPELITLFLGAVKAGIVPMVLSTRISPVDFGHALTDSEAAAVFMEAEFTPLADGNTARTSTRDEFVGRLEQAGEDFDPVVRADDEPAFWVCSSGSTSRPKSVVHTHGGVTAANGVHRNLLGVTSGTKIHCTSKLSFAYPLSNAFLAAMDVGATVILYPHWHDPDSLLGVIDRHAPEVVFSTPTLYRRVVHAPNGGDALTTVRAWVSAGEHLSPSLCEDWRGLTGQPILDCYGTSETLFLATATPPERGRPDSSGPAAPGVELALCDHDGRPVDAGEIGELQVRHPFLAAGYANNPEQTRRRFRDGWFATGDLFVCDRDGYWYYRGREDSRIKIAGQWVHLQDIEDAVAGESCVRELATVSAPDEDGLARIALFVVAEPGYGTDEVEAIVNGLLQGLPTHKRPRWVQFTECLPRTNTGKIKLHELQGMLPAVSNIPKSNN